MKKHVTNLLFCFVAHVCYGQLGLGVESNSNNKQCNDFLNKEVINKLKNSNPLKLVPYSYSGNKWGLMDSESKKIIIDTIMHNEAIFRPNLIFYNNQCRFEIDQKLNSSGEEISLTSLDRGSKPKGKNTMSTQGFELNSDNIINRYYKEYLWLSSPVVYNDNFYAVAQKKDKYVLVSQNGNEIPGFNFKDLRPLNNQLQKVPFFYFEDFNGKKGFISIENKTKLYGKIFDYIYYSNNAFGYSIQVNKSTGKTGVLDLSNLQWVIKPQKKYEIKSVIYSSNKKIDYDNILNRPKANIYYLVKENSEYFVLDTNGNPIKPIKNFR